MIIDRSQIEKNIARIRCGDENGTAFLIADQVAATARHIIGDASSEITLEFLNISTEIISVKANIIKNDILESIDMDIAFLQLEVPIQGYEHLQFENKQLAHNASWVTFSYPAIEYNHGLPIQGTLDQIKTSYNPCDYDMILRYEGNEFNPEGVSGSPVIIDGTVRGIITDDKAGPNLLGAISTSNFAMAIESIDVIKCDTDRNVSDNNFMVNDTILGIKAAVTRNESGCIFIKGVPGSGKTVIATELIDVDLNAKIVGKYLVEDKNDEFSAQYKSSPVIFGKWLINCISKELYGRLVEEREYDTNQLTENTIRYMNNLSILAKNNSEKYVFILDGFDQTHRINSNYINEIFGLLPTVFKEKILFIVFGNNENIYPDIVKNSMSKCGIIEMQPFSQEKVINYFKDKLFDYNFNYEILRELSRKSEGNPLYIHYIIKYVQSNAECDANDSITNLPDFEGEIENYYRCIWNAINNSSNYVKVTSILARIRGTIEKGVFIGMLDGDTRLLIEEILRKLKHLLIENEGIRIYHSSFSNFIIHETNHIEIPIQKNISEYCVRNNDRYSVENKLYHLVRSDNSDINMAIGLCNQDWIDELARNDVDPDLILVDTKEILNKAVELKIIHEIFRIQLLIQRLKFRYDKVFRQYAFEMSKAVFENKKHGESLKYMIREKVLVVNLDEALFMLRRFLQEGEVKYAEVLLEAIKNRCIKDYQNDSIPYLTVLTDISSIALFPEYNLKKRFMMFRDLLDAASPDDNSELMAYISADISGYAMWDKGHYMPVAQMEKNFGEMTDEFINIQLKLIQAYIRFESTYFKKNDKILVTAVKDLEELCKRFNVVKNDDIAQVLIKYGTDLELINTMLPNINDCQFTLRAENGVDLDFAMINKYYDYYVMKSFMNTDLDNVDLRHDIEWERYLQNIIEFLASAEGVYWKSKFDSDEKLQNKVMLTILESMTKIVFELKERSKWDRSYSIPEHFMPFVWCKMAELIIKSDIQHLRKLVTFIILNEQLGVYNEGYRRVLFKVADVIINEISISVEAFPIIEKLERITEEYVQNRWERTRDYLEIIFRYGKIGALEKANLVYKKMLETSMGPSWYKEAQMTLMGSCIEELCLLPDKTEVIIEALANLDYSSGEMTFQRYVRDEKERFVKIIGQTLGLEAAIEYFKFLTFPSNQDILKNAKNSSLDKVKEGYGYVQGTKEIDLQDGILNLIRSFNNVSYELVWGLTEIFIQGDDRYFYEYSGLQLDILEKMIGANKTLSDEILLRIERQFVSEFDNTRRYYYLAEIQCRSSIDCFVNLKNSLESIKEVEKVDFTKYSRYQEDSYRQSSDEDIDDIFKRVDLNMKMGNKREAKVILASEILKVAEQGYSVFNHSRLTNQCLEKLKDYVDSAEEFVDLISTIIKNPYGHLEWTIVNELLELIGSKLSPEESARVMNSIMNHFEYLIRTPVCVKEKFNWLSSKETNTSNDDRIVFEFIIWLAKMPNGLLIKNRVFDVALWIVLYDTNRYLPYLIDSLLFSDDYEMICMCCAILHNLSQTSKLEAIAYCVYYNEQYQKQIIESGNFLIISTFYEIFKSAFDKGTVAIKDFYEKVSATLFKEDACSQNKLINIDCDWLNTCMYYIDELNNTVRFDTDFIDQLSVIINEKCAPVSLPEMVEIEKFIERSYSLPTGISGYYNSVILSGVNKLIGKYVTKSTYKRIIELLRPYNPKSPELILTKKRPSIFENIQDVICEKNGDYGRCCEYEGKFILHFHEAVENSDTDRFDRLEVVAFLVDEFNPYTVLSSRIYDTFSVNTAPQLVDLEYITDKNGVVPLILKSDLAFVYGSMYTPSEIHPIFSAKIRTGNANVIQKDTWRDGRVLDVHKFGMPKAEGSCLLISKKTLNDVRGRKNLIFRITFNDNDILIDYDNKVIY
jgi:hypothetical protein